MKGMRHKKILEIISEKMVTTQEELQKLLEDSGFVTTQATISRDIKDLRLIKTLSHKGSYYYTVPNQDIHRGLALNISKVFVEAIRTVDHAENIVVIKCMSGLANAVCAAIDSSEWDGLLGTIAGDDTIFLLLRTKEQALEMEDYVKEVLESKN